MFRDYGCHVYREVNGNLVGGADVCWGSIFRFFEYKYEGTKYHIAPKKGHEVIYIDGFDCEETRPYQELIVGVINEITPCEIEKRVKNTSLVKKMASAIKGGQEEKRYIKYKLLNTYDQNLVLLNFIRNLWHQPTGHDGYCVSFFKHLEESHDQYKDPLQRLTWANKKACKKGILYSPTHSNVHAKDKLKIKAVKDLMAFNGNNTFAFLST